MNRRKFLMQGGAVAPIGATVTGSISASEYETGQLPKDPTAESLGGTLATQRAAFLPYSDAVETIQPDEAETFNRITATIRHLRKGR